MSDITQVLDAVARGEKQASEDLLPLVYEELRGARLQVQTKALNTGLSTNWVDVPGSSLTNNLLFAVDTTRGSSFYRLI